MSTDSWIASLGTLDTMAETGSASRIAVPLADQGVIRVSGTDAVPYLHNLLTNDIQALTPSRACRAGLCTPKGRLLALFLVWREADDVCLMLPRDILPAVLKKLSMYVLRSKAKLSDATQDIALIGLAGGDSGTAMSLAQDGEARRIDLGQGRAVLAVAADSAASTWAGLLASATPAGLAAWTLSEIRAGQPRVTAETQEAFVPQMLNLELPELAGVSFTKGCYPGQEIVARTQYLGKVKRRTFRAATGEAVVPGTHVYAPETGDQACGTIVSGAPAPEGGHEVLVCVQIGAVEAGEVHVGSSTGPRLEFRPLPYAAG